MRPSEAVRLNAAAVLVMLVAAAVPASSAPGASTGGSAELDAVRQECIAAASELRQREQTIPALEHTIDLLRRDAGARQRDLDDSRPEQQRLLGALLYLARNPPERSTVAAADAIERRRSELLLEGTLPVLRTEARALLNEIEKIAALRRQIAAQQSELGEAREALVSDRQHLAELVAHRLALTGRLAPEDSGAAARHAKFGREASDLSDLIARADDAAERRDKLVLAHAHAALPAAKSSGLTAEAADPTWPHQLRVFDPPHSLLEMPVSGTIALGFGAADTAGTAIRGLRFAAPPGAEVVAPFDGRVIYAGRFGDFGLVLIIRHGGLYHSLLAGLGRVDIRGDQWILAGEPVGAMPDSSGALLYFELRRDDRPIDPQPWLATAEAGRGEPSGDQKERE